MLCSCVYIQMAIPVTCLLIYLDLVAGVHLVEEAIEVLVVSSSKDQGECTLNFNIVTFVLVNAARHLHGIILILLVLYMYRIIMCGCFIATRNDGHSSSYVCMYVCRVQTIL